MAENWSVDTGVGRVGDPIVSPAGVHIWGGAASCGPLWSAATGSPISGAPAVSNGRLDVGTSDGRVIADAPA